MNNKLILHYPDSISYSTIDKNFLGKLDIKTKDEFINYFYFVYSTVSRAKNKVPKERFINNLSKIGMYFEYSYCPYCKKSSLKLIIGKNKPFHFHGSHCGFCGEQDLFAKKSAVLKKVQILLNTISKNQAELDMENQEDKLFKLSIIGHQELNSVLYEQIITLLATSLEVFLKDAYSLYLNITLIKSGKTEIERFRDECKNDFVNNNKIIDGFKKIGINLKRLLSPDTRQSINQLFHKRHVIVHNNGMADKSFVSQSGIKAELGKRITIDLNEIHKYISCVEEITKIIGDKCVEAYNILKIEEFQECIWKIAPCAMIERVLQCTPTYSLLHAPNFITAPDISKVFPKPIAPSQEQLEELKLGTK